MREINRRLGVWAGLCRNTWAKVGAEGNDTLADLAWLVALVVLAVPSLIGVVVFGRE
jgi:hypothetical protein